MVKSEVEVNDANEEEDFTSKVIEWTISFWVYRKNAKIMGKGEIINCIEGIAN